MKAHQDEASFSGDGMAPTLAQYVVAGSVRVVASNRIVTGGNTYFPSLRDRFVVTR